MIRSTEPADIPAHIALSHPGGQDKHFPLPEINHLMLSPMEIAELAGFHLNELHAAHTARQSRWPASAIGPDLKPRERPDAP
ncbi:hypothetical protein [Chromobacterium violaceum]|uniref:hypothetical protein n=1 Tax=Chromobacterium violaceum TaxID=536 RepID=UPI0015FCCA2D|nr:hypothetical protein [Chromobacterium violaceum]MBA8734204.1 hypothetical protein [Chromobacterium violaceum]